ncbi:uncharacterized protein LOC110226109 isoform X2 [Arabidopsis lyrata subsp. lyrata]|uniref:uncharacterized protein LOC110226109 isoform X2 n=1 Tax=Arabidopsis lyrata subsp. lyrata TaxID=81972 RepID=UPI000A29A8FC|nr:uncharacterized protein LOC110226109 isoform X2 [Arabidopsis lyrata subsp. lyrata]|eukprot:XP_020872391.1 uncharacterized protein LOC110226109 isoform X2 [Arabidopsis lyrata subsp. lyrata]
MEIKLQRMRKIDHGSKSDLSDVSKGGVRCQILNWQLDGDVVVGEGEFCSSEHTYKIGRIPLGPNAAAVLVNSVSDKTASLWRPLSQTIVSLHQAIGMKVAWPFVKIILDDDATQPPDTMMSEEPAEEVGLVDIYEYWREDDEVIA